MITKIGVGTLAVLSAIAAVAYLDLGQGTRAIEKLDTSVLQQDEMPRFTSDGKLTRPEGWEAWVMVGTSVGLTYTEGAPAPVPGAAPGMFLNVYMQPWAYREFRGSGEFPEGTMFILAGSDPVMKADPARGGFYESDRRLMEIHLKKTGLHESGWGFYGFGGDAESAPMIPGSAACYSCHAENTALDNVFVQFYPALRDKLSGSD